MEAWQIIAFVGAIICGVLAIIALVLGIVIWWLRRKGKSVAREWEREGRLFLQGPVGINFSGIGSKGMGQVRGNGFMALTDKDLRITRAVPSTEWRLLHRNIKGVSLETSFLGKRRGRMQVLVIDFDQNDQPDRIGVYVRNSGDWMEEIVRVIDQQ